MPLNNIKWQTTAIFFSVRVFRKYFFRHMEIHSILGFIDLKQQRIFFVVYREGLKEP